METLVVLAVLGIVGGGTSVYYRRKRENEEYEEFMGNRISFACQELTAKKIAANPSVFNSEE
jgi:hypothetical protein